MINILRFLFLIASLWIAALFGYVAYIGQLDADGRAEMQREKSQSIVVLTGGDQRIATGLELLQEGIAPELFISGVGAGVRLQDILPKESEALASRVSLGSKARDTLGNADEVAEWLGKSLNEDRELRVVLVTGHYHLPRALWHLSSQMPKVVWIPIAAHPKALSLETWYSSGLGWRLLSSEFAKFLGAILQQAVR